MGESGRRLPRSLRARVTAVGVATLLVVLGLGAWVTVRALAAALRNDLADQNAEVLDALAQAIAEGADPRTIRIPIGADGTEFTIVDQDGWLINASALTYLPTGVTITDVLGPSNEVVVFDSGLVVESLTFDPTVLDTFPGITGPVLATPIDVPPALIQGVEFSEFDESDFVEAGDWFETERSVTTPEGAELRLQAFSPLGIIGRSINRLAVVMLILVPLLALAGGLALWQAIGAALAPVQRISDEARRIAPSNSGDRLPVPRSGDEIAELTGTLNDMLDRLDAGLARQRQFVSDASHELRSPLTVVRGASELLSDRDLPAGADGNVAALRRGVDRLEAVLDDLTDLASAGKPASRRQVDLAELVGREVELVRADRLDRPEDDVVIEVDGVEAAMVEVNPVQLGRAVNNLVTNGVRHAEGRVAVGARVVDDTIEIVVDDDGPGVAVDDRTRIFDRFVRLDDGRSRDDGGTGLGLALVASIAADHAGEVTCTDSPLGGARFVLRLAAAPSSAAAGSGSTG